MIVMAPSHAVDINFVVTGNARSGAGALQSALSQVEGVVCHTDLLYNNGDPKQSEPVRRAAHEAYFGPCANPKRLPEWCSFHEGNPCRYLNEMIFDRPLHGERAVGVRLDYATVAEYDLYDLFHERWRAGDFCLVHVERNPVACFVSLLQAQRYGVWRRSINDPPQTAPPPPVHVDVDDLVQFCRQHEQRRRRLRECCPDQLTVRYYDIVYDFQPTMDKLLKFLERPSALAQPACRRLRNNDFPKRVINFAELRALAPKEVRGYLTAPDCV